MDEDPQQDVPREPPAGPGPEDAAPKPKRRRLSLFALRLLALVVAITAGLIVSVFSVDLGPHLRELAEREGSKYLKRPMHVRRLVAKLTPGEFEVHDLVIEGLTPQDRPFLVAKMITVKLPWWTALSRRLVIESITMTDWDMVIETFPASPEYPNGGHNLPRFKPDPRKPGAEPIDFTTTLRAVLATRGRFTYADHGTPWSTSAPNLTVQMYRSDATRDYRGHSSFSNGTVSIMSYLPFRADMQSRFSMDGGKIHFDRIDLVSDGARSVVTGDLDLGRWPEQLYQVRSRIDFPTQKNIFFHGQKFDVSGTGDFTGTFHLFKGGRELQGTFQSDVAGVNDWRFPDLRGSVLWLPDRLEITNATSRVYGGTAKFDYRMAPLNRRGVPARAVWDVEYRNVSLPQLTDFLETEGLRLSGSASGRNHLEWPLGRWAQKRGRGEAFIDPPAGIQPMTRELPADRVARLAALPEEEGPFNPRTSLGYLPVAGRIAYSLDPEWITLGDSWAATSRTYVQFQGRTAYGQRSEIPFHVSSLDWQESDRVLAAIMTVFGAPTGAVPVGGYGEFDGVMLESFNRPLITGHFTGEQLRAWDVVWGSARADRRRPGWRIRRVRRRDARIVQQAAHHGPLHGRAAPRLGRGVGQRARRRGHRERLREGFQQRAHTSRIRDSGRWAVLARLPAARRRRGDRRAGAPDATAHGRPKACLRAGRLQRRRPRLGRVPHLWRISDTARLRPPRRGGGKGVRGDLRESHGLAAVRRQRRPAGQHRDRQGNWRRDRRGVGRLGWPLLVRRRRQADSDRIARRSVLSACAAVGPAALQRQRSGGVRVTTLRREPADGRPLRRR
jgi:hypothetical protein